jgi:hypothetical protein
MVTNLGVAKAKLPTLFDLVTNKDCDVTVSIIGNGHVKLLLEFPSACAKAAQTQVWDAGACRGLDHSHCNFFVTDGKHSVLHIPFLSFRTPALQSAVQVETSSFTPRVPTTRVESVKWCGPTRAELPLGSWQLER